MSGEDVGKCERCLDDHNHTSSDKPHTCAYGRATAVCRFCGAQAQDHPGRMMACNEPLDPAAARALAGHGWVTPNADGYRARCGGPSICPVCQREKATAAPDPLVRVTAADRLVDICNGLAAEGITMSHMRVNDSEVWILNGPAARQLSTAIWAAIDAQNKKRNP